MSVIVVNYNYGRFLSDAITSVFAQTYPRIECLLVDNASTDESPQVIELLAKRYDDLVVIARDSNGGQTLACLDGLARARGPYVVFLDADDYLLAHCVERHMRVHLSSRIPVGFTSGDMLQIVDGAVVLGTNEAASAYVAEAPSTERALLRATSAALGDLGTTDALPRVRLVARDQPSWIWAPTSGNCFRRDALDLVCDNPALPTLASQTDLYLAFGINGLCGSILIDEPLFAYRLHGANVFSNRAQLQGFLTFDGKRSGDSAALARRLLIEHLVTHVARFVREPWMAWDFLHMLDRFDTKVVEAGEEWRGGSYAAWCVAHHFRAFAAVTGRRAPFQYVASRAPFPLRVKMFLTRRPVPA